MASSGSSSCTVQVVVLVFVLLILCCCSASSSSSLGFTGKEKGKELEKEESESESVVLVRLHQAVLPITSRQGQEQEQEREQEQHSPPVVVVVGVGVVLSGEDVINEVSSSVLGAESWLRTRVLSDYPASNVTHIIVNMNMNFNLLCSSSSEYVGVLLACLKNLYYSLTRWGLQSEIKISPSFDSFSSSSSSYGHSSQSHCFLLKNKNKNKNKQAAHLLEFIDTTNSTLTYIVRLKKNPRQQQSLDHDLVSSHLNYIIARYNLDPKSINLGITDSQQESSLPRSRKLSSYSYTNSYTTATAKIAAAEQESSLPPLVGSFSFPPHRAPSPHHYYYYNSPPPMHMHMPTPQPQPSCHCNPSSTASPPPEGEGEGEGGVPIPKQRLWCVAKPSVPAETLQEAIDFACGVSGGADCEEIQPPNGKCYSPDTVVAHASYAFNSYWQNAKRNGGTCDFGGTAMIINTDPSFLQCTFAFT